MVCKKKVPGPWFVYTWLKVDLQQHDLHNEIWPDIVLCTSAN